MNEQANVSYTSEQLSQLIFLWRTYGRYEVEALTGRVTFDGLYRTVIHSFMDKYPNYDIEILRAFLNDLDTQMIDPSKEN